MSESSVNIPPNSTGVAMRLRSYTVGTLTVYQEIINLADPTTPTQLQGVNANGQAATQQGWNAGRTNLTFLLDRVSGVTTEALASCTINKANTVTTTNTSYTVTTGKTLRLQNFSGTVQINAAVIQNGRIRVRQAASSISVSSGIIMNLDLAGTPASAGAEGYGNQDFPDGCEIPGGQQIAFSQVASTTAAVLTATLVGFEY